MLRLTLKSLLSRKLRFALTTFAVVLGVAFVSGAFIIADSLRATFDQISEDVTAEVSVQVRGVAAFEDDSSTRPPVPESLLGVIAAVDGVDDAQGVVEGLLSISFEGELLTTLGGPTLGFNYTEDDTTSSYSLTQGRAPGAGEMLIDSETAAREGISLGDTLNVRSLVEPRDFAVVGILTFDGDSFGTIISFYDTPTAQALFQLPGAYDSVDVSSTSGIGDQELAARVSLVLPADYEAVTSEVVSAEFSEEFDEFIDIFQTALLAFAAVALVVSAFIINNTFAIVLGQRIKELGLLRCLGATGRQVRLSVMGEALLVGVIASLVGVLGGLGVAKLITWAIGLAGDGAGLPAGPTVIGVRTWAVSIAVGVGITLLAALAPARRAASIPPIAAITDTFTFAGAGSRRRTIVGAVMGVVGGVNVMTGVFGSGGVTAQLVSLGAGALLLFIAVALLSPLVARPMAQLLGRPVARFAKIPGALARENAARNPRRTSATASALMVGLALVAMVLVVGESFKATFTSTLDTSLRADYFIQLRSPSGFGFSPGLVDELNELPEIDTAVGFRGGPGVATARIGGKSRDIAATQQEGLGKLVDPGLISGSYEGLADDGVLVYVDPAQDLGLAPGDVIGAEFPLETRALTVVGIFDDASITGNWVIALSTYEEVYAPSAQYEVFAAATVVPGLDVADVRPKVDAVAENYPEVRLENRSEFQKTLEGQIDQLLLTVNALLVFAIVIAALGVVNTMMLSVFERIREIGLLRAVGMTRRQTRRMIRWEAVIVTVFGGLMGVALGLVFGFIALAAMPKSFVDDVAVPFGSLVVIVILCAGVGVLAAILPARRAARLNVLDAISHA
ncbi:MAG TPA: hypothetical protein DEP69_02255 [Acidimicrobiaceae bacterium]|nr:hypothetical protein [Acidimicrobiaceae bacterium]